jgi:hypothetical protein
MKNNDNIILTCRIWVPLLVGFVTQDNLLRQNGVHPSYGREHLLTGPLFNS